MVRAHADLAVAIEREIEAVFGPPPKPKPKTGKLVIASGVPGVKIYVDGEYVGANRVELDRPAAQYSIRMTRAGYHEEIFTMSVTAGETTEKLVTLEALPEAEVAPPPPKETDEDKEFYEEWWFWTATIGGAALVATAVGVGVWAGNQGSVGPTGDVTLSVEPAAAWRDVDVRGQRGR